MSTTPETAAFWSATPLATDPKKIGAAGLSVRQRKLLTLLSQPMSASQLASSIALPIEEVHTALDRFARLGLARSGAPITAPFDPMQLRATPIAMTAASASPARTPLLIGVAVAALALAAAAAWAFRGSSAPSSLPTPSVGSAATDAPRAPTATGAVDSSDTASGVAQRSVIVAAPARALPAAPAAPTASVASVASVAAVTPVPTSTTREAVARTAAVVEPAAANAPLIPAPAARTVSAAITPAVLTTTAGLSTSSAASATSTAQTVPPVTTLATFATQSPTAAATTPPAPAGLAVAAAPTVVAALSPATPTAPTRAAPTAAREIKLLSRVEPAFPRGFDATSGTVRARLQVDSRGIVTGVDIVEANPPRVFDRSVRAALQQWRYEATGEAFATMAEISFSR